MSIETKGRKEPIIDFETKEPSVAKTAAPFSLFARQPLSTLGKTATWGYLISAILCGVVALILTLLDGSPSQAILMIIGGLLVTAFVSAIGTRWGTLLSTLMGGYLFYTIFTQPFVLESLADPKGPTGGFGHFIGDVQVCTAITIAFVASIGATLQGEGKRKAPRVYFPIFSLILGMAIGAALIGAIAKPSVTTGSTTTNGVPTIHVSAGNFDQTSITISKGSKLVLVGDTNSQHVLFNGSWKNGVPTAEHVAGQPTVNSVSLQNNSVTIGPFATAGTYHIYCAVHSGMNLTITVQ